MKNLLLLIVVITGTLMVGEGITRLAVSPPEDATRTTDPSTDQCAGMDAPYERPGHCYTSYPHLSMMEYAVSMGHAPVPTFTGEGYHTNANRMRYDTDLPIEKPQGERRIFITGGSAAWGAGVDQKSHVAAVLEQELRRLSGDNGIRVINAGVSAYTSVQELMFSMHYIAPLKPDMVIAYSGWNDLYAGYTGQSYFDNPDFMRIVDMVINTPLINPWHQAHLRHPQQHDNNATPPDWNAYNSKLGFVVAKALFKIGNPPAVLREKLDRSRVPLPLVLDRILRVNSAMNGMAQDKGYRFVYALQPSLYSVDRPDNDFEHRMKEYYRSQFVLLEEHLAGGYVKLATTIEDHSQTRGYQFINTGLALSSEQKPVFADHVHLGDRGCRLVAQFLAPIIMQILDAPPIGLNASRETSHRNAQ